MATTNLGMGGNFSNGGNIWDGPNMGMAQNLWDLGKNGPTAAPAANPYVAPAHTYGVQPSNPNQASEIANIQANVNKGGFTQAQASQLYGDEAVQNAMAKGLTFGQPSQNLGMGGSAPQANPYLDKMAEGITSQMNDNWTRNLAPSIRSGAMAAGGFGGSRQGVVEANGLNDLNRTLGQSLTSLYGQDWTNSQNRNLQQQQITNQNNQYYSGLDSNNAQFGANLGLNTMNAQNQWALNGVNAANQIQQTPINYFNGFNNNANQIAGQGGTSSQTNQGNPYVSALGGMQLANSLYKG